MGRWECIGWGVGVMGLNLEWDGEKWLMDWMKEGRKRGKEGVKCLKSLCSGLKRFLMRSFFIGVNGWLVDE